MNCREETFDAGAIELVSGHFYYTQVVVLQSRSQTWKWMVTTFLDRRKLVERIVLRITREILSCCMKLDAWLVNNHSGRDGRIVHIFTCWTCHHLSSITFLDIPVTYEEDFTLIFLFFLLFYFFTFRLCLIFFKIIIIFFNCVFFVTRQQYIVITGSPSKIRGLCFRFSLYSVVIFFSLFLLEKY